jgi:hypothetical protein
VLKELSGVDPAQIAEVDLKATHSYLFAEQGVADALLGANGKDREGKAVRVERPRPQRRRR